MFFEIHNEKKIGYKKLSPADLGISETSKQTHIGLSGSVLTFISDRDEVSEDSIFIYEDKFEYIDAYFDRIENPDGSYRSPKIRVGDVGCVSVVSTIRTIVKELSPSLKWYLVWFGLKNDKIVFLLFNDISKDFEAFSNIGINLNSGGAKFIDAENPNFATLISYIEEKVNRNGEPILKELEIITQIDTLQLNERYKVYDIEKANETNKKIGRNGEELIDKYLNNKRQKGLILSYTWYNKDKESGCPYDFSMQDNQNNIIYLDVKTTGYNFEQQMIFSSQEIEYIANTPYLYCIYRVYKNEDNNYLLRICDNCKDLSLVINEQTKVYSNNLKQIRVGFRGSKFAIDPNIDVLTFKKEIKI